MSAPDGLRAYAAVTAAYWAFMLTDGALRMLVLLHFHTLGFSPFALANLFLLYELMGIVTNLTAGWLGQRFGLRFTLYAGLAVQIAALLALSSLPAEIPVIAAILFVMVAQGLSGIAKDLTKMSAKSAVKLLAPKSEGGLFRWVAVLTGSKNAVKGLGFFLGAALLGSLGFRPSLILMAAALVAVLVAVALFMPDGLPGAKKTAKFRAVFSTNPDVNALSLARVFLFGARDTWFVVGIPVFFYGVLSDGTAAGNREAFFLIGGFMALWIMFYGAIQIAAPRILSARDEGLAATVRQAMAWSGWLVLLLVGMSALALVAPSGLSGLVATGLFVFAGVFALNSALHSYLILAFSGEDRVTMDVGFYYMANASGRLLGTLLSGLSYQALGLPGCLAAAALMAACAFGATVRLSARHPLSA